MKHTALYIVLTIVTTSCLSKYEVVNCSELNKQIMYDVSIQNPVDLMKKFIPYEDNNNNLISWEEHKEPGTYKITLHEKNCKDDCIKEVRTIMFATYDNDTWYVTKIKQQWKCREDRGHTFWSSKPCN